MNLNSKYYFLKRVSPSIKLITTSTIKIKNMVLAIDAAPAAIPLKPNMAAMIAITKKIAVHFNMMFSFLNVYRECSIKLLTNTFLKDIV